MEKSFWSSRNGKFELWRPKKHVKKLWEEDPKKYYEWKQWCIEWDQLPNFFGTRDNPIDIDESEL